MALILSCNMTDAQRCKSGQAASQGESMYVFISIPVHSRCVMLCLQRRTSSKQGLCVTARKAPNAGPQKWILKQEAAPVREILCQVSPALFWL